MQKQLLHYFSDEVLRQGDDTIAHGYKGYSRKETAELLGLRRMTQFNPDKNSILILAAWALSSLSKTEIRAHQAFMEKHFFINLDFDNLPVIEDCSKTVMAQLSTPKKGKGASDKIKSLVVGAICENKPLLGQGLTSSALEQARQSCKTVLTDTIGDVSCAFDNSISALQIKLDRKINSRVFLELALNASPIRIRECLEGQAVLYPNEIALINILSQLKTEVLWQLVEFFIEILSRIERFKCQNYIPVKNLAPFLKYKGVKNTKFLSYFDRAEMVTPPEFLELVNLNALISEMKSLPTSKVNEILQGDSSKKPRKGTILTPMSQLHDLVTNEGMTVYEAGKKCNIAGDKGNIYKAYQNWLNNWSLNNYWSC